MVPRARSSSCFAFKERVRTLQGKMAAHAIRPRRSQLTWLTLTLSSLLIACTSNPSVPEAPIDARSIEVDAATMLFDGSSIETAPETDTNTSNCPMDEITSCARSGLQDIHGACALYHEGTICSPSACENAFTMLPARSCDGKGTCLPAAPVLCSPFACSGGRCAPIHCNESQRCPVQMSCFNGFCAPRAPSLCDGGVVGESHCSALDGGH